MGDKARRDAYWVGLGVIVVGVTEFRVGEGWVGALGL